MLTTNSNDTSLSFIRYYTRHKKLIPFHFQVRILLREQCLTPQPEYTEKIRENIKIFDRLFAEFEFNYVQCMVHVKSVREYETPAANWRRVMKDSFSP